MLNEMFKIMEKNSTKIKKKKVIKNKFIKK